MPCSSQTTSVLPMTTRYHCGHVVSSQWASTSILAGLEAETPDLASRAKLTIHVVGADDQEIRLVRMTEDLYHLLPKQ